MDNGTISPSEMRLIDLLRDLEDGDADFRVLCGMTCRDEGLTEELVEYMESNRITKRGEVYRWLFGEPRMDDDDLDGEDVLEDEES